jgi:hypothetical protein
VRSPQPPLEYLVTCSQSCLEGFELARRDQISKLRAELRDIHEEWIEAEVAARLSRLLLDGRRAEIGAGESPQFALDSIASARQTSATPSLAAPLSGLAGKSPVSLFRPEQCVPGDHRSMPSPEAAALRPRHPESAALQLRRSSDVGSRASARQVPPKRMRAQLDAANNSRQKISHQSTSHGARRSRRSAHDLQHFSAVGELSFFRPTGTSVAFVALRIRPSQQLPLFQPHENDRQTHGAYPTKTCEPNRGAIRVAVSGPASPIPENLKASGQCSRSHSEDLLPEQECFLFLKSESTPRRDAVAAENTSARVPKSARHSSRAKRPSRVISSSTREVCEVPHTQPTRANHKSRSISSSNAASFEGPPTQPIPAKPASRFRHLISRIPSGRRFQPSATIVGRQSEGTGAWLPTLRNLSFFHCQTSCPCPS